MSKLSCSDDRFPISDLLTGKRDSDRRYRRTGIEIRPRESREQHRGVPAYRRAGIYSDDPLNSP